MDENILIMIILAIIFMFIYFYNEINKLKQNREKFSNTCTDSNGNITLSGKLTTKGIESNLGASGHPWGFGGSFIADRDQILISTPDNSSKWLITAAGDGIHSTAEYLRIYYARSGVPGWNQSMKLDYNGDVYVKGNIYAGGLITPNIQLPQYH